jgi:hypothetical protein
MQQVRKVVLFFMKTNQKIVNRNIEKKVNSGRKKYFSELNSALFDFNSIPIFIALASFWGA